MKINDQGPLARMVDLLMDAVCVMDPQGRFLYVSAAGERLFGYTPQEMLGRPMIEMVHPEDRDRTLNVFDEIESGEPKPHFENRNVRKDGGVVHIMWSAIWSPADQVRVAVARDVTELKRAESIQAALYAISEAANDAEDLQALFQRIHQIIGALLPAASFSVALYDEKLDQVSYPYYIDALRGTPPPERLDSGTLNAEVIRSGKPLLVSRDAPTALPAHIRARPGSDMTLLDWLGVPLCGDEGVIGALVVRSYCGDVRYTQADVELLQFVSTQVAATIRRKQMASRLLHIALHDTLTGLPNRGLFLDRLKAALPRARRDATQLALLYLDLDMFKPVNDTFGHAMGDLLLQQAAKRLQQCVRETDTVGRVGGDEFLVLLDNIQGHECSLLVAEKIRVTLSQPFDLAGHQIRVSLSIGIALYPGHGNNHEQLIQQADQAMYAAKNEGGNQIRLAITSVASI
jgi:diguanylate cyclase (GGDEF)-like protein/PAS domain S-box-containing protein